MVVLCSGKVKSVSLFVHPVYSPSWLLAGGKDSKRGVGGGGGSQGGEARW